MAAPKTKRQQASQQRRQAILDAALDVFAADGFSAARLDDVAEKAGVAKGTIYLFFKDKEELFEQMVVAAISPVLARFEALAALETMPLDQMLDTLFTYFQAEVLATRRRDVIWLVLTEGRRFPHIAETYHRMVVSKGLGIIRRIAHNAYKRGEISWDGLERFPHLIFAPPLMALIWGGLFSTYQELDVADLLKTHRQLLMNAALPKPQEV
ncbi:MAG: TetR/AcrR family transcriptional regulator [Ancalomicrobiaceae bacterium]|nr:TetR/AcrR family transcriptional regulator [Ancalomicrobiaceae bacterium]